MVVVCCEVSQALEAEVTTGSVVAVDTCSGVFSIGRTGIEREYWREMVDVVKRPC